MPAPIAQCGGRMAGHKLPKAVVFIAFEDFPRSATGKVKRHEMAQRLAAPAIEPRVRP